jgi:hypothetical protein
VGASSRDGGANYSKGAKRKAEEDPSSPAAPKRIKQSGSEEPQDNILDDKDDTIDGITGDGDVEGGGEADYDENGDGDDAGEDGGDDNDDDDKEDKDDDDRDEDDNDDKDDKDEKEEENYKDEHGNNAGNDEETKDEEKPRAPPLKRIPFPDKVRFASFGSTMRSFAYLCPNSLVSSKSATAR